MRAVTIFAVAAGTAVLLLFGPMTSNPANAWGWQCDYYHRNGCPVTPQYFRYRPPSLDARCWESRYGIAACPYSERPPWWHGCWMNRYGRMVCNKGW